MEDGQPYEAINHSPHAQALTNAMSQFFLSEARRNHHAFTDPQIEDKLLIYHQQAVYSGPEFVQSYYFV